MRPGARLGVLLLVFLLGFVAIVVRLGFLQVKDRTQYKDLAIAQRERTIPLPATRGAIVDRSFRDLALSLGAKAIYADQRYIQDPMAAAEKMAGPLKMKPMELARLLKGDSSFVYVARQVDRNIAEDIQAMNIPGIGFLDESKRYYPAGEMGAPQVVGYTHLDGSGGAGLELQYQDLLTGEAGERQEEIDPEGHQIPQGVQVLKPPVPGQDLVTTIDAPLQFRAQQALEEAVKREHAKNGTLIAMNPHTGEIYAMASYPWFNPNDIGRVAERKPELLSNPAVASIYEPGSVNKVITASAIVEEHAVDLHETFVIPDSISETFSDGTVTVHDSHPHPPERMTLGDIITQSSNVGTITVARKLGGDLLASYLSKFGFGRTTGLDFPGESPGILPEKYLWSGASMLNIPIGQGVSVTPLQMTSVYATVANDGVWVQPRLVRGTRDATGFHPAPPSPTRRVVSKETADIVTGMLANVVASSEGTGTLAQIPGYWVAGKTGTAQKPDGHGGYSNKFMASFIGFLPASDPQIVIAAILDEPDSEYGGLASAPLFQQFGKEAIARLRIPPGSKPDLPPTAQR